MPATSKTAGTGESARALVAQLTPGTPQPALTAAIEACQAPPEAKAGLFLLNGDWRRAHETAQDLDSETAAYWHAIVHRHEPDFSNSKYWLRRTGASPIHARLVEAARAEGKLDDVAPKGQWDAVRFTDCYARGTDADWTRRIEAVELQALLEHSLAL
jgi:hypothetical protein